MTIEEERARADRIAEACRLVEYDMLNRQTGRGQDFVGHRGEVSTIINYVRELAAEQAPATQGVLKDAARDLAFFLGNRVELTDDCRTAINQAFAALARPQGVEG